MSIPMHPLPSGMLSIFLAAVPVSKVNPGIGWTHPTHVSSYYLSKTVPPQCLFPRQDCGGRSNGVAGVRRRVELELGGSSTTYKMVQIGTRRSSTLSMDFAARISHFGGGGDSNSVSPRFPPASNLVRFGNRGLDTPTATATERRCKAAGR